MILKNDTLIPFFSVFQNLELASEIQCEKKDFDNRINEILEIKNHPWFVASQFHPELKSRVNRAHPLFREFVKASVKLCKALQGKEPTEFIQDA